MGRVQWVDAFSVLLLHQDGTSIWWPYGAVTVEQRAIRDCAPGDVLRTVADEAHARAAFGKSDALFGASLLGYLGSRGTVQEVHQRSVLVQHEDGQQLWWPQATLTLEHRALQCSASPALKTQPSSTPLSVATAVCATAVCARQAKPSGVVGAFVCGVGREEAVVLRGVRRWSAVARSCACPLDRT